MSIDVFNMDCLPFMKACDEDMFDLAIVDPPYGIGENWKKDKHSEFYKHNSSYKNSSIPDADYFKELFRVSRNQIVWGGNYFSHFLLPTNSWIVWDKDRKWEASHMSEGELAWHSFKQPLRIVKRTWNGFHRCEARHGVHPHEKPVGLYTWLLEQFATPGQRILDTHLGSGSSAIAAHYYGCEFVGTEIDAEYFASTQERIDQETRQVSML